MYETYKQLLDDANRHSHSAIGAAIEVHRRLGPGYLESVYEQAFAIELRFRKIAFERQVQIGIPYRGESIGAHQIDFLIEGCLVIELKAVESVAEIHRAQLLSYLRTINLPLGLLLNFKVARLREGIQRVIQTDPRHTYDDLAISLPPSTNKDGV